MIDRGLTLTAIGALLIFCANVCWFVVRPELTPPYALREFGLIYLSGIILVVVGMVLVNRSEHD